MNPVPPVSLWPDPDALGPLTDLYQLTMMAGYQVFGKAKDRATFEMFVRRLPKGRAYLIFAGLEQALGDLQNLRFSDQQVEALRRIPALSNLDRSFYDGLRTLRFEGDVWAVPEGTVVFAGAPLLRVEAPLPQAQWVESFLLASIGYPTLVASKAARVVEAAAGRPVYDFGLRRGHGPHAGMLAARAAYLAGGSGTSNVDAAIRLGIPCAGTMAHSWVQSFDDDASGYGAGERVAFESFGRVFPEASTLLVDTYDTIQGIESAARVEPPPPSIRIDSGDLLDLSRRARALLDARGRNSVKIFASGDLDEWSIQALMAAQAPIDAFGVGTELITSRDAPALSLVYKLVELNGRGRVKLSPGKKTYPLGKQVYRQRDRQGRFSCDRVTRADETSGGEPLLVQVMHRGAICAPLPSLDAIRERCRTQVASLPDALRGADAEPLYPLAYSWALEAAAEQLGVR